MILNNKLFRAFLTFWILFVSSGFAGAHAAEGLFPGQTVMAAPAQPTKLADFEFANLHGGTLNSAEMKGKVIIIRFWATW